MKITVKTQNNETLSYPRRPETARPVRISVFYAAQFHMARSIQRITRRASVRKLSNLFYIRHPFGNV
jgi:hypothetical protein